MKRIVKVSKFNLSDIVADYEEIVSARYILKLLSMKYKALSWYLQSPLISSLFLYCYMSKDEVKKHEVKYSDLKYIWSF